MTVSALQHHQILESLKMVVESTTWSAGAVQRIAPSSNSFFFLGFP